MHALIDTGSSSGLPKFGQSFVSERSEHLWFVIYPRDWKQVIYIGPVNPARKDNLMNKRGRLTGRIQAARSIDWHLDHLIDVQSRKRAFAGVGESEELVDLAAAPDPFRQ